MLVVCGNVDNGWACAQIDGELEVVCVVNLKFDVIFAFTSESKHDGGFPCLQVDLESESSEVAVDHGENDFGGKKDGGVVAYDEPNRNIVGVAGISKDGTFWRVVGRVFLESTRSRPWDL